MNQNIKNAISHLENANTAGYFEEMDKVEIPKHLKPNYAQLKVVFMQPGQAPWDFSQKLETFASTVAKSSSASEALPMSGNTTARRSYDIPNIRRLLMEAFTDTEFMSFCQDYYIDFYNTMGSTQDRTQKTTAFVSYCRTRVLFDEMLQKVERINPAQYSLNQPYYND